MAAKGSKGSESSKGTRLRLGSSKQRTITHHYGRPVQDVVARLIAEGKSVEQAAALITHETGIEVKRSTLYRWLHEWQEEDDQQRRQLRRR